MTDSKHSIRFPGESESYRDARSATRAAKCDI